MRIRLMPLVLLFVAAILVAFSFSVFSTFKNTMIEDTELKLFSYADSIAVDVLKKHDIFKKDTSSFLISSRGNEFVNAGILLQFFDSKGDSIGKSQNLKNSDLPFFNDKDDYLREIELEDGVILLVYQRELRLEGENFGYVVVGMSMQSRYSSLEKLKDTLIGFGIFTIILLYFGISAIYTREREENQKRFLSFASHELRTPLSVISGNVEVAMLADKNIDEYRQTLMTIKEESDWLNSVVTNMMTVFRGKTGKEKMDFAVFNMSEMIQALIERLKTRYPRKNILFKNDCEFNIRGDRIQIRKAVDNILENAAKYTDDEGRIEISILCERKKAIIIIKDNGIGMDQKMTSKIFDPFFRIDNKKSEGMGLGLAIAKWVIDAHRGSITVTSKEGEGTIFRITLNTYEDTKLV